MARRKPNNQYTYRFNIKKRMLHVLDKWIFMKPVRFFDRKHDTEHQ